MKAIIYLHGFNSSPQSEKAQVTREYFEKHVACYRVHIPALPPGPNDAINVVDELIQSLGRESVVGFIGSSLGGYYSLYLQHRYQLPAVLINPAIKPYELLLDYLGENKNLYTGERYLVETKHIDELKSLEVSHTVLPESLFLLTQTGDEVLPYHQAVDVLDGAKMWIQPEGSHAFENFPAVLPAINCFFKASL